MEQSLQQLLLEEEITLADFKEHRIKIEAERARLQNVVDTISQRQHLIKADFEVALQLATELDFLFEKGTFNEKRLLCETVFKRVYLKEGRVSEVELNAPFGLIASRSKGSGTVLNGCPLWIVPGLSFEKKQFSNYFCHATILSYFGGCFKTLPKIKNWLEIQNLKIQNIVLENG